MVPNMLLTDLIILYDPDAEFSMSNEQDINTLNWIKSGKPKPSLKDLDAYKEQYQLVKERNRISVRRQEQYGPITEQLDYIVKNGIDSYRQKMLKIKEDNPYPTVETNATVALESPTMFEKLKGLFKWL